MLHNTFKSYIPQQWKEKRTVMQCNQMWMLQLLTTGSWLLKTTVCHQSELKGKTWVTVLACVGGNKLVTDMNYYEKPTRKLIVISTKCLTDLSDIAEKKTELRVRSWKDHFSNTNYFIKFLSDSTTGQPELTKIYITPNLSLLSTVCSGTQLVSWRHGVESHRS